MNDHYAHNSSSRPSSPRGPRDDDPLFQFLDPSKPTSNDSSDGNINDYSLEDEVDELLSEPEDDRPGPLMLPQPAQEREQEQEDVEPTQTEINVSAIKKSRTGKVERIPGHSLLPLARLESIMQADGAYSSSHCSFPSAYYFHA